MTDVNPPARLERATAGFEYVLSKKYLKQVRQPLDVVKSGDEDMGVSKTILGFPVHLSYV